MKPSCRILELSVDICREAFLERISEEAVSSGMFCLIRFSLLYLTNVAATCSNYIRLKFRNPPFLEEKGALIATFDLFKKNMREPLGAFIRMGLRAKQALCEEGRSEASVPKMNTLSLQDKCVVNVG